MPWFYYSSTYNSHLAWVFGLILLVDALHTQQMKDYSPCFGEPQFRCLRCFRSFFARRKKEYAEKVVIESL